MKYSLIILIILTILAGTTLALAASSIPLQEHLRILESWKAQIDTIKWIGGAMVAGLVTAVGTLWASLNRQRKEQDQLSREIRHQLLTSTQEQTQANTKLAASLDSLRTHCHSTLRDLNERT